MTGLCWKRWCILNVPKKTFPSFSSSQHYPWHFHLESRLKMVEKNGLKTEEIVRWSDTESTLLLDKVWSQKNGAAAMRSCVFACKNTISYEEEQKKDNGVYSTRHFLLLFFLLGMLRLFDHMVVSGANCLLLAKTLQKRKSRKSRNSKKKNN